MKLIIQLGMCIIDDSQVWVLCKGTSRVIDFISDIEAQIRDLQSRKKDLIEEMKEKERVGLGESGFYDRDIYDGGGSKYDGYVTSIAANDEVDVSKNTLS